MLLEYRELFLEELDEQLQTMEEEILKLEQEVGSEEAIQSLFRAAHTLKGSSATMGFEAMTTLTHEMEHLLEKVRSNEIAVTELTINLLFESLDLLKLLKEEIVAGQGMVTDISQVTADLQAFAAKALEPHVLQRPPTLTTQLPDLNAHMRLKLEAAYESGLLAYWVRLQIAEDSVLKKARTIVIHSNVQEWGDLLYWSPDPEWPGDMEDSLTEVLFLLTTVKALDELQQLASSLVEVTAAEIGLIDYTDWILSDTGEPGAGNRTVRDKDVNPSELPPLAEKTKTQTVRVSVDRLDHLMNLVGELVIDQTRVYQVERNLSRRFAADDSVEDLGHISDHLTRIISELQESVMKARMLPIEQLLNRFPRLVRDLSQKLGKEVELVIEGKETELDRTLIEDLSDPMIHLIRNAIDHGIESPERRELAGKPPQGTLTIRAAHEDNQVVIYIKDDGAGIDSRKMRESAVQKGIIGREEANALTDREAVQLIFLSGFSTAQAVSDVSGRGVGMDIVRDHIEKLNGIIDIETELGRGTEFKIKLPLTLAIITGLLVRLSGRTFVIPMSNIAEIVRLEKEDIQTVRGESVIVLRNRVIPVISLYQFLNIPEAASSKHNLSLVIIGAAEKRVAVAVDELLGNQEVVLKSLGGYLGKVNLISGATILGDGNVALILEASALIGKRGK